MVETHWKKLLDKDFLGVWDFEKGEQKVGTIKSVIQKQVGKDKKHCPVVIFAEQNIKPLVVNVTNGKTIEKLVGSADINKWVGKKIQIYADPSVKVAGERVGGVRVANVRVDNVQQSKTVCEKCSKEIVDTVIDGVTYSASQIVNTSYKKCGKKLCYECYKTEKGNE